MIIMVIITELLYFEQNKWVITSNTKITIFVQILKTALKKTVFIHIKIFNIDIFNKNKLRIR